MPDWVIWVIAAALLAAGEAATVAFILGPIGFAALVTAAVAAVGAGVAVQLIVFILGSVASVVALRPIARRHLRQPAHARSGAAALIGAPAEVLERVDGRGGRVKLAGEVWSARAFDEDSTYEVGTRVEVLKIEGATALVAE